MYGYSTTLHIALDEAVPKVVDDAKQRLQRACASLGR